MTYRVIGLMSGSSLDGLDIAFVEFEEVRGQWSFQIKCAETIEYNTFWKNKHSRAATLSAYEFALLDNEYGRFTGEAVNSFIDKNNLQHQVQLISSHGHTVFHTPQKFTTVQIGNAAQIAALTGINVVSDLRALDIALGGQGAPIVPIGEKYLFTDYNYFLNIGGIANLSIKNNDESVTSFDVCVANQVLNYFAKEKGKLFDENGAIAASGKIDTALLTKLNGLQYYKTSAPKSLSNQYFVENILPIVQAYPLSVEDILRTYTEHIASQIAYAFSTRNNMSTQQLLVTGGGAFNSFLIKRIQSNLSSLGIEIILPDKNIISYKEALIMAFLGIMRWREENTILPNSTGALRPSIGGAVWIGQEY